MTGNRMKAIRDKIGWTQEKLAKELGIHAQTVSRFERNEQPIPKYIDLAVERLELREKSN